MEIILI